MYLKKLLLFRGLIPSVLCFSGLSVSALTYTDIQNPNQYVASRGSYTGIFDIVDPRADHGLDQYTISGFPSQNGTFTDRGGYVPGTPISDLTVRFYLTDASLIPIDVFAVSLDGYTSAGLMIGQKATFSFKGGAGVIDMVEADGLLSYTVSSILGDFTVKYALLTASTTESNPNTVRVPDGGLTVTMLGLGLLAIAPLHRRFRSAK